MSTENTQSTHGLGCPRCGGMVPIPEGQAIVQCPFCSLRSSVRGERGVQRYQVTRRIEQHQAVEAMRRFLSGHGAIAGDAARKATLSEAFVAYVPFWTSWTRVLSWVFGQKQVGSGEHKRYEAREVRVVQDAHWNGVACDVGEFGVESVPLTNQPLLPFDADALHAGGMVFEPVGSFSDAQRSAAAEFERLVAQKAGLDRVSQTFTRYTRQRMGLVYYPLWVMRYLYRGRTFQVVVDGFSGQTLYGKAPGNVYFRAAAMVGGAALGSLVSIDGSALLFYLALQAGDSDDSGGLFVGGLAALVIGFGIIAAAYRAFRFGEQYEYRLKGAKPLDVFNPREIFSQVKELDKWIDRLT